METVLPLSARVLLQFRKSRPTQLFEQRPCNVSQDIERMSYPAIPGQRACTIQAITQPQPPLRRMECIKPYLPIAFRTPNISRCTRPALKVDADSCGGLSNFDFSAAAQTFRKRRHGMQER